MKYYQFTWLTGNPSEPIRKTTYHVETYFDAINMFHYDGGHEDAIIKLELVLESGGYSSPL